MPATRITPMLATPGSVFMGKFWKLEHSQEVEILRHLYRGTLTHHLRFFYFKEFRGAGVSLRSQVQSQFSPILRVCLLNSDQLNPASPLWTRLHFLKELKKFILFYIRFFWDKLLLCNWPWMAWDLTSLAPQVLGYSEWVQLHPASNVASKTHLLWVFKIC